MSPQDEHPSWGLQLPAAKKPFYSIKGARFVQPTHQMWRHISPSWSNVVGENIRLHANMLFVDGRNSTALESEGSIMLNIYLFRGKCIAGAWILQL
jgi:hypothetical protein